MNRKFFLVTMAATALCLVQTTVFAADGATAPYNEAVTIVNGKRVVDVRTIPPSSRGLERSYTKPGEGISSTYYAVETDSGLMDCSRPFYYPTACVPSDYGKVVRSRAWVVKRSGTWQACLGRAKPIECIPLVADGKVRALKLLNE